MYPPNTLLLSLITESGEVGQCQRAAALGVAYVIRSRPDLESDYVRLSTKIRGRVWATPLSWYTAPLA